MDEERHLRDEELRRRAEAALGKVLRDKWRLDALIGLGGMAAVYSATHRNGKRAAVKVLHAEAALAPTVKDRFLREGYVANKVGHPGAVSILDDDIDVDGTVFLVMELLHGETLDARAARLGGTLPAGEVLQIADQVLDCLTAAHDKGIVHRDLKPGNLFLTQEGTTKILDFGIAHLEDAVGAAPTGGTGSQTLGTPGFMPPEQARGRFREVDAQSDLWALGAVMFSLLSGHHVHEAATVNEQLLAAMTVPAEPLRTHAPDVHESVAAIVDRALQFAKESRFLDAPSMRAALRTAYESVTGAPLEQAPRLSSPAGSRSGKADVATLDEGLVAARGIGQTTARPVTHRERGESHSTSRRSLLLVAVAAGAALVGLLALGILRGKSSPSALAPSVNAAPAAAAPSVAPGPVPEVAAPVPPAPPPAASAPPPPVSTPPPAKKVVATSAKKTPVSKPAPAPTAESVDLFTRRR